MDQRTTILPPPASASASVYAGFWRRFGAVIIDGLAIGIPAFLFGMVFIPILGGFALLFIAVASALYYIIMHGRFGATLGKMALGIRVTQLDGSPINYSIAAWRYSPFIALTLLGVFLPSEGIGNSLNGLYTIAAVIVLLVNDQKRTIHDFIAKTVVLKKKPEGLTPMAAP